MSNSDSSSSTTPINNSSSSSTVPTDNSPASPNIPTDNSSKIIKNLFNYGRILLSVLLIIIFFYFRQNDGFSLEPNRDLLTTACLILEEAKLSSEVCRNTSFVKATSTSQDGVRLSILDVAVTSSGNIVATVSSSSYTTVPTLLGNFGPYHSESITFSPVKVGDEIVDPAKEFPDYRTLTIYSGQQQYVYDLGESAFEITFEDVDATVWNDPRTGNVAIGIYEPTQADELPVLQVAMVKGVVLEHSTQSYINANAPLPSNCTVIIADEVMVTENARTWGGYSVTGNRPTSTLDMSQSYYLIEGPQWGSIRWDTNLEGWWWSVSDAPNGESLGWIWEGRIEPCR